MFTQLSLFDQPGHFDSVSPAARGAIVFPTASPVAESTEDYTTSPDAKVVDAAKKLEPVRVYGDCESTRRDSIQPMGDLARLVIARYEMMARRREEMMRRKAENPRKSIRVLSPAS
jgi:hypothetical protein